MLKLYSFFFFFLLANAISAQSNIVIKGTVIDVKTQLPIELATVNFSSVKDSALIANTITDKNGFFSLYIQKYDQPVFIKINYQEYQCYLIEEKKLLVSKDYGKLYLLERANALDNVVIKSKMAPVNIKKDTLEFNVSSYKVRPDSNVETLLKQLPGFDIDANGKVTVNGKKVTQFLVNGKTFFDRDGTIAIKNLPADIIKKVQVSDFKTKKEELSGQGSTSDYSTVNLTIDEKKNRGIFGKILAAYGSDERYESSLMMSFFNNKQKISVLASSNNINSTGFSMDDVFGAMAGGRNNNTAAYNTEIGNGITQTNLAGVNYSDQWYKKIESGANYNFLNIINKNSSKVNQTSFLPNGNILSHSNSNTKNEKTSNKANLELEYKINPTTQIFVFPQFDQSAGKNRSDASVFSEDQNGESLNRSNSESYAEIKNINFRNNVNFNKVFKKSANLSLIFSQNNSTNNSDAIDLSETFFYKESKPSDQRNQNTKKKSTNDSYSLDFEYTEPVTDSLRIGLGANFYSSNAINDEQTFNFDTTTQSYSHLNLPLTNYTTSRQNMISAKLGINWKINKFTIHVDSRTDIIDYGNHSLYLGKVTDFNKKYALPYGDFMIRYEFNESKDFALKFDHINLLPVSAQLLPVVNLSNPLNTIVGNPDLNPIEKSSVNFIFRGYNFQRQSGYSLYNRVDYYTNNIIPISVFDDSGKSTTTYANISGTYRSFFGVNWYESVKRNAHSLVYSLGFDSNYSFDKGYTNDVLYNARSLEITPKVYLTYTCGDLIIISPSYSLSYSQTNYENYSRDTSSNVIHKADLETTVYWPENLVFGNDLGYTYNSEISSGFKKYFFLWNTSLSYAILNKKMFIKVKVYDVLNQNQNATRTISSTSIRDEENTVLKRYVMFSLSYKIENFALRKKNN